MVRSDLPPGVSPTNDKSDLSATASAPPTFAAAPKPGLADDDQSTIERSQFTAQSAHAGDGHAAKPAMPRLFNPVLATIIIAGVLAVVAAAFVAANRSPQPLCSEQPHWNQYNCRAG